MNRIKKYAGLLWMLTGPAAMGLLLWQAAGRLLSPAAGFNDWLQWGIILLVFLPIAAGFCVFGWYAWKGEYNQS